MAVTSLAARRGREERELNTRDGEKDGNTAPADDDEEGIGYDYWR